MLLSILLTTTIISFADTPSSTRTGQLFSADELSANLKTQDELDKYFLCHITTGQNSELAKQTTARFKDYKLKEQKYIQWASEAYQMPNALAQCLMFRESWFDNSRVSTAGAVSMAQMTSKTYDRLQKRIEQDVQNLQYKHEYDQLVQIGIDPLKMTPEENSTDNPVIRWHQFANRTGPYYNQATDPEKEKSYIDGVDNLAKLKTGEPLYKDFYNYMQMAKNNLDPALVRKYFPNSKPGASVVDYKDLIPPKGVDNIIKNPVLMIGVQMYYLKEMMLRTDYRLDKNFKETTDPIGFLALIAGGYNAGDENLLSSAEGAQTAQEWCANLKKKGGEEVTNYMLSIRRCLLRGDNNNPTGNDPTQTCNRGLSAANADPCLAQIFIRPKRRPDDLKTKVEK